MQCDVEDYYSWSLSIARSMSFGILLFSCTKWMYDNADSFAGFGCIVSSRPRLFLITLLPIQFWISALGRSTIIDLVPAFILGRTRWKIIIRSSIWEILEGCFAVFDSSLCSTLIDFFPAFILCRIRWKIIVSLVIWKILKGCFAVLDIFWTLLWSTISQHLY